MSETKTAAKQEIKNEFDAHVIEYLQTPFMFDFFHKKVNMNKFLREEEWHTDTVYFMFVPIDFDFESWREVIKNSSFTHDFAYNLGKLPENKKSWKFTGGVKRYIVGKELTREEVAKYNNEHFNNGLYAFFDFNKFCITEKGSTNYIIPMHDEDECVHDTGKKAERYKMEENERKLKEMQREKEMKEAAKKNKKPSENTKDKRIERPLSMEVKVLFKNIVWEDFEEGDDDFPGTEFISTLNFFVRDGDSLESIFNWHLRTHYDHDVQHFEYDVISQRFYR